MRRPAGDPRARSIDFLPRPLLDPPIQALDSDRVADGIAFMRAWPTGGDGATRMARRRTAPS
jgi:hypothetical protein